MVKIFKNTYNILWTFGGGFAIIDCRRACEKSVRYDEMDCLQYIERGMELQAGVNKMKKEEVFWDNESNKKGRKSC